MTLRFRPPPLAGFYATDGVDHAAALIEAREQGFAEGRSTGILEGHAAGIAEGDARARGVLLPELDALQEISAKRDRYDAVARSLRVLLEGRDRDLATLENNVREVASAALRTLFPVLLSHAAGAEIAALLAAALAERAPETLTLRAHPDTLAVVASETAATAAAGRLTLAPDLRRPSGSVEIDWAGGGLTFDPAALLSRVTAALGAGTVLLTAANVPEVMPEIAPLDPPRVVPVPIEAAPPVPVLAVQPPAEPTPRLPSPASPAEPSSALASSAPPAGFFPTPSVAPPPAERPPAPSSPASADGLPNGAFPGGLAKGLHMTPADSPQPQKASP